MNKSYSVASVVREYFPDASDEVVEIIVWGHTGYPCFWSIPEDGASPLECFRKQLKEFQEELKREIPGVINGST